MSGVPVDQLIPGAQKIAEHDERFVMALKAFSQQEEHIGSCSLLQPIHKWHMEGILCGLTLCSPWTITFLINKLVSFVSKEFSDVTIRFHAVNSWRQATLLIGHALTRISIFLVMRPDELSLASPLYFPSVVSVIVEKGKEAWPLSVGDGRANTAFKERFINELHSVVCDFETFSHLSGPLSLLVFVCVPNTQGSPL